nr:hypothetical protein [Roseovarius indicus]
MRISTRHGEREVPRHHGAHDADGLAHCDGKHRVVGGANLAVDLVDRLAEPGDAACGGGNVAIGGVDERLAHVQGFEQGEIIAVFEDQLGEPEHDAAPVLRGHARPCAGLEGGAGALDGVIDIRGIAIGDGADGFAGAGEYTGQGLA